VTHRTLVTGATGFVGSHLVRRLVGLGHEVSVIVRPSSDLERLGETRSAISVYEHDGTTQGMIEIVQAASPDTAYHLASLYISEHNSADVSRLIGANVEFAVQLMEALVAAAVPTCINTGTSWQFARDGQYAPVNLYAATKQACEDLFTFYTSAHALKVLTLALFDTYGPGDPRKKLLRLLWDSATTGHPLLLSPGRQRIDLVYIDDVIDAFVLAADVARAQTVPQSRYAVSSGAPIALADLVGAFAQATGMTVNASLGARPYRAREVMVPWDTGRVLPGWTPRVSLAEGILKSKP